MEAGLQGRLKIPTGGEPSTGVQYRAGAFICYAKKCQGSVGGKRSGPYGRPWCSAIGRQRRRCRASPRPGRDRSPAVTVIAENDWDEVRRWRVRQRQRLAQERLALGVQERKQLAERLAERLASAFSVQPADRIAFYWPLRGELDLRPYVQGLVERGARAALPVVVEEGRPLEFWHWEPGTKMRRQQVWGIPVPAERVQVRPTVLLVPLLGFDEACHRLGQGGGYYDRTLAALEPRPLAIGVGLSAGRLATIHPQPHDIPMDLIVTEAVTLRRDAGP